MIKSKIILKLDSKSKSRLKKEYKIIYGKDFDNTGEKFCVYTNVLVGKGMLGTTVWLNEKEFLKLNKVILNCTSKFKTIS